MDSTCDTPCTACSSDCGDDAPLVDMEDFGMKTQLSALQSRVRELESKLALATLQAHTPDSVSEGSAAPMPERRPLRSTDWFGRPGDPGMVALYAERYLNYGMTKDELLKGKPIIGIAQSGSDLTPCNRHHLTLSKRVADGIRAAGGVPMEFPMHPIQENVRRPTAALDRNLAYLALVEVLHAYPLDGVVLLTGCDKTTPACLMAAATVDLPAVCLNVGPMLNGWDKSGNRIGSGSVIWEARKKHAAGEIDEDGFLDMVTAGTPSPGHCNTMGTASTLNGLAEALGMTLPGTAAIPAADRERSQMAYKTGELIVDMVHADRRPSGILTREAFENAIVVNSALGGSTNAPIHLCAIAKHAGVGLGMDAWDRLGSSVPLLVNMQPAGQMLGEDFHRAGGVAAVMSELLEAGRLPHPEAVTVNGRTVGENVRGRTATDRFTIRPFGKPLMKDAGFLHLTGNLFDSAIMKTSVISPDFRAKFLEDPKDPNAFECKVVVFDGPEDYHARLEKLGEDGAIDERTILIMRGVGPLGYPGAAEVVNMHAPSNLLRRGVRDLPCIGDGRQSGTSGSPSILNASPEAADGGNLALLRDGDVVRVDLGKRRVDIVSPKEEELVWRRLELDMKGGYPVPESQTPWQDIHRREASGLSEGMVFRRAVQFQRIAGRFPVPRDNH